MEANPEDSPDVVTGINYIRAVKYLLKYFKVFKGKFKMRKHARFDEFLFKRWKLYKH